MPLDAGGPRFVLPGAYIYRNIGVRRWTRRGVLRWTILEEMRALWLILLMPATLCAQDAHWGVEADSFAGAVPKGIVKLLSELPEEPEIYAQAYNVGLTRFRSDGAPSWTVAFSRTRMRLEGELQTGPTRQVLRGNALVLGAMVTRYLNFFSRSRISGGLAFGGGIGQLDASYYRYMSPPGPSVIIEKDSTQRIVPVFQTVLQADIRPARWISLSPFYGLRNGALGAGVAVRIHFTH